MKTTLVDGRLIVECDGTGGSVLITHGKIINIYVERGGAIVQAGVDTPKLDPDDMAKPWPTIQPQPTSESWHEQKVRQ